MDNFSGTCAVEVKTTGKPDGTVAKRTTKKKRTPMVGGPSKLQWRKGLESEGRERLCITLLNTLMFAEKDA